MTTQPVRFESDGRTGRVVLSRPDHGNRIDVATMRAFIAALERAGESDAEVLVLGAEGPDFSLGRDQEETPTGMSKRDNLSLILDANALLSDFDGVTVAAVRGRALGFGSGVAAQCDLTLASETASLGFTEIQHGFAPSIVMTYLETYVTRKAALDLLMTGREISATEAQRMGLVTRVVADADLDAAVDDTVTSLLGRPPSALRQCKFFLRSIAEIPEADRGKLALDALTGGS